MNAATYTKIAKSTTYNDGSMSLGFRRFTCIPNEVKINFDIACYLQNGTTDNHDYKVSFFGNMTEQEYKTYIITH
jgi:hypothetical protein